jgi:hypothetical protein
MASILPTSVAFLLFPNLTQLDLTAPAQLLSSNSARSRRLARRALWCGMPLAGPLGRGVPAIGRGVPTDRQIAVPIPRDAASIRRQ